jgi:hypothetical protein
MRGASNGRSWKPGSPRTAANMIGDSVLAEFASAVDAIRCAASPRRSAARCDAAPAVEPVIGHVKAEHRMGRNYLKGRDGDRINALLAAAGFNFGLPAMVRVAFAAVFIALFRGSSDPATSLIPVVTEHTDDFGGTSKGSIYKKKGFHHSLAFDLH